jgi:NitT/TauT family transport system substrate-binding protein
VKIIATFLAGAVLALTAQTARADMTKIAIGTGFSSDTLAMHMAKQAGIFEKNGLDATVKSINGASTLMSGLFAGDLQFIFSNQAQLLNGVNGGLDLLVVAGGAITTRENDPIGLVLRTDVPYAKPADLVGKKIGTAGFDSGTYMLFRAWLEMKGVDYQKVDLVESPVPNMEDLLRAHQVDGVTAVDPFLTKMVKDGVGRVAEKYYTDVLATQPSIFWVSSRQYVGAHADVVRAFQVSLQQGAAYVHAHPDEARALELKLFNSNKPALPNDNPTVTAADLQAYYDIGKKLGMYTKPIDCGKLIDPDPKQ